MPQSKKVGRYRLLVLGILLGASLVMLILWYRTDLFRPQEILPARVIMITVDTLRADHLQCYGYRRRTSPFLDSLAQSQGVRFSHAYASSSWTLPSMMSVFTSLYPPRHGVEDQGTRLDDSIPTLSGAFAASGWYTAAFITHIYVSHLYGFDRGFREFHELSIDWNYREGLQLRAGQLNAQVFPWLDKHRKDHFFLYLHYFDPHWDYNPPAPYNRLFADPHYIGPASGSFQYLRGFINAPMPPRDLKQVVGLYDGEIAYTSDRLLDLFLKLQALNLWDDTLLVLIGDHGEEFQEHGSVHHIRTLYEEVLRVPLIIKPSGGRGNFRPVVPEVVGTLDLAPTILQLAHVPVPPTFQGVSLEPLMKDPGKDRTIFARTLRHASDKIAIIQNGLKVIYTFNPENVHTELYDLNADPAEKHSLDQERTELAGQMKNTALNWMFEQETLRKHKQSKENKVVLEEEQKENLKSLGYAD